MSGVQPAGLAVELVECEACLGLGWLVLDADSEAVGFLSAPTTCSPCLLSLCLAFLVHSLLSSKQDGTLSSGSLESL